MKSCKKSYNFYKKRSHLPFGNYRKQITRIVQPYLFSLNYVETSMFPCVA